MDQHAQIWRFTRNANHQVDVVYKKLKCAIFTVGRISYIVLAQT